MKLGKILRKWQAIKSEVIRADEFGEAWPFVEGITQGLLQRKPYKIGGLDFDLILFRVNGKNYAVNGIAKSKGRYTPVDEIWAPDPRIKGAKKSMRPIIQRGLAL